MKATRLYGPRDVRCEDVPEPKLQKPTDAIIRLAASCICGSDLWPYRGDDKVTQPMTMGHEYCGVVETVGSAVKTVKPGQFVVGSFCLSDNTCPHCKFGFQSSCEQREFMTGAQAPLARVALEFGATDIVSERGDAGVTRIKVLTKGVGADAALECVGAKDSMMQAIHSARPGAMIGYVGVPHSVSFDGEAQFFLQRGMLGGPAPVRRFLPHLINLVLERKIQPGKVFDLTLPLDNVADGYQAMDERRAVKTLLTVC